MHSSFFAIGRDILIVFFSDLYHENSASVIKLDFNLPPDAVS